MLLPALEKAKDAANRIKCINNIKQISNVNILYTNDFNGYCPQLMTDQSAIHASYGNTCWTGMYGLLGYLPMWSGMRVTQIGSKGYQHNDLFTCSVSPLEPVDWSSYGINSRFGASASYLGGSQLKLYNVKRPGQTPIIGMRLLSTVTE
jgi:hypothetical protein